MHVPGADVGSSAGTRRPPLLSIGLISAAALAYEILLMRLYSIIQWHHFAYMMISLALLGFGVSGTFLALARDWLRGRYRAAFVVNAAGFGIASVVCFLAAQTLPFNALEVVWDPRQPAWLLAIYLLLFVPFFCAANCICLSFIEYRQELHRVYGADLVGAGIGAAGVIGVLYLSMPLPALGVIGALGWLACASAALELRWRRRVRVAILLTAVAGAASGVWLTHGAELRLSEFKGLRQALAVTGARVVDERVGPLGLLTTVESPVIPFRHAPGLSLAAPSAPPSQLAVFTDGDAMSAITQLREAPAGLAYLDFTDPALAYHLLERPEVLVLGAGGGGEVLLALHAGAAGVDAVEVNPQMVRLVRRTFAGFAGGLYDRAGVRVIEREARGYVAGTPRSYDLIQIALLDSFAASSAGLHALGESHLYTVEAFSQMLDRLTPGGLLSVTRWLKLPPRDGAKVFATAVAALERRRVADPGAHLAMIRSWNTTTLLVGERPLTGDRIAAIKAFSDERWFDPVWYPGMARTDANRHNQWQAPWLHDAAVDLLGPDRDRFLEDYKFDVRPATDNRPYFFHFLKWRTLPEFMRLRGQGGTPLIEQGYLLLVATLAQAMVASVVLILLPLWLWRGRGAGPDPAARVAGRAAPAHGGRVVIYFLAVGLAFMGIEIAFIQKFTLFLSHPLYAVAVVLAGFLVFAGLGSRLSRGWTARAVVTRVVAGIAVLALVWLAVLPPLFAALMAWPDPARIAVALALIAPLAVLMGMPFPLGLDRVAARAPGWIPWAWGVNGCASVVGAVLATVLAIHFGFVVVVLVALGLYGLAAASVPR